MTEIELTRRTISTNGADVDVIDADHVVQQDAPEPVNATLVGFLDGVRSIGDWS